MFHPLGWTFPFAVTAVRGTHYCLRRVDYPMIWRLLHEEGITHLNAAPTVCTLLCADPNAKKLEGREVRVTVAASPPTATLFERMERLGLKPVHVYGLTETYGPITRGYVLPEWEKLAPAEKYAKMARQGFGFVTSQDIRVVKSEHLDPVTGTVVDVKKDGKEVGEIVFTGNICAKGYFRDAEATRKLWEGGVNHSGDLAVWEPDGSVRIIDRGKDVIISGESCHMSLLCGWTEGEEMDVADDERARPDYHALRRQDTDTRDSDCRSRFSSMDDRQRTTCSTSAFDIITFKKNPQKNKLTHSNSLGGENISSLSVESILIQHPSILEVAIVAIPDEKFGERPLAYVTLATTSSTNDDAKSGNAESANPSDILAWAKAHPAMSGFMVPKAVEIVAELPKTSTGKVRKNVLREWAKGAKRDEEGGG